MFIIWDLAKESKAGRIGTFAMFLALSVGFIGYAIKVFCNGKWRTNMRIY
jgi:hypothetical protein